MIRHQIYASEISQHPENSSLSLSDQLDNFNHYIVAKSENKILGFISITPPSCDQYSIEKYFQRPQLPFTTHKNLYEIRLLTIVNKHRNGSLLLTLAMAAFRWVQSHGGTHICAIGRSSLLPIYRKFGLTVLPQKTQSGAVTYHLMHASVDDLEQQTLQHTHHLNRITDKMAWKLPFPLKKLEQCFHGGAFFSAIGQKFKSLEKRNEVINADVLDAWFPPAPAVIDSLKTHLPWLLQTSPPTNCEGLIETLAESRGVNQNYLLPGAGSSDLIFRAFQHWLNKTSRVLILDPTYGEYAHVLEKVIGCHVTRLKLQQSNNFQVNLIQLTSELQKNYDLVILVNPNSPTGQHIARNSLEKVLHSAPTQTRIWIDETYIEYVGTSASLETFAAKTENVIICKSMSKVYALSGARVAYLCAAPHQLESLRAITPPWVIGLPSQLAAVKALENPQYYAARYQETHHLRERLTKDLQTLGWKVTPTVANFLLCELSNTGPSNQELIKMCRSHNLFLRDPGNMGGPQSQNLIRIAVKDQKTNTRIMNILKTLTPNL